MSIPNSIEMGLTELIKNINAALRDCQSLIYDNPQVILSEADFERYLSNFISDKIGYNPRNPVEHGFSVHSQISHHREDNRVVDARVDILIFRDDDFIETDDVEKRFKCSGKSIVIELKYLHTNNHYSIVQEDFDKINNIGNESWLYVVVLLDNCDKGIFLRKKREILKNWKDQAFINKNRGKIFCRVLEKIKKVKA